MLVYVYDGYEDSLPRLVDTFENYVSLIWTDRYLGLGQFQLKLPWSLDAISSLRDGNWVTIESSEYPKIIETIQIEDGTIVAAGRDLTSILDRRLVLQTELTKPPKLSSYLYRLVDDSIGHFAKLPERSIPYLYMTNQEPDDFPHEKGYDQLKYGANLLEAITNVCKEVDLGFRIIKQDPRFYFDVFYRKDHTSYGTNVAFRVDDGTLTNPKTLVSSAQEKNVAYVRLPPKSGEGVGEVRRIIRNTDPWNQNLTRRELWVDASSIRQEPGYTDAKRFDMMSVLGKTELAKDSNERVHILDFEISPKTIYEYGSDYHIGDIVYVTDGTTDKPLRYQVAEYIQSHAAGVTKRFPTLTIYDEKEF